MRRHFNRFLFSAVIGAVMLLTPALKSQAAVNNYSETPITLQTSKNLTTYYDPDYLSAATPELDAVWDCYNQYHVGYLCGDTLVIQRYNEKLVQQSVVEIKPELPLYGNFTTDGKYYYVVTGQENYGDEDQLATCTAKYTLDGKKVGCCELTGYESNPYAPWYPSDGDSWGTKSPFAWGNCRMDIQGNLLSCNYGRVMFNGHQSNFVFFVNTETMKRVKSDAVIYNSHSFDQDVLATSDGGFLFANRGDAYDRGIKITKVSSDLSDYRSNVPFHFREGSKSSGYQQTFAQWGGFVEIDNCYVICASSEKTLSLAEADGASSSHNEARNLFIQMIKKDFSRYGFMSANDFVVAGETRNSVGTHPSNPGTEMFLPDIGVADYGVIWLTDYDDNHFVNSPKIAAIDNETFVVLWEKAEYRTGYYYSDYSLTAETYYAVINAKGDILTPATLIPNTTLPGNVAVSFHKGSVYWVTADGRQQKINKLKLQELKFREQPADRTVYAGETVSFCVKAAGAEVTYQWQKSTDGGKTWVNSGSEGAATDTLTMTTKPTYDNLKFRCVIKDADGKKLVSNTVTLAVRQMLKINTQPSNKTVTAGDTVAFTVKAAGDGLKYRWKKSTDGGVTWVNSASEGAATDTLQMSTKLAYNGFRFKCVISDRYGEIMETKTVILTVRSPLAITANPVNATVEAGNTARFTVKATGDNLTYQWKKSTDGGVTWVNSSSTGATTGTLSMTTKASYNGLQFKCVVKDKYGKNVSSTAATLSVTTPLKITSQPGNVTAEAGKTVSFKVAASGEGLSYRWKKSTDGGATWVNSSSSGAQSAVLTMAVKGSYDGYCFKCVVTDQRGKTVTSETAKLTVLK